MKETNKQRATKKRMTEIEFNEIFSGATITPEFLDSMPDVTLKSHVENPNSIFKNYNITWWEVGILIAILLLLLL